MRLVLRKNHLLRRLIIIAVILAMLPSLTGVLYRLHVVDQLQEIWSKKAIMTEADDTATADYKKPRYNALDYLTLVVSLIIVARIGSRWSYPIKPTRKLPEGCIKEIFVPPEF